MNRISAIAALGAVLGGLLAAPAHASISRTYVASFGSDANSANDCNFSTPCRTFQTALTSTLAGGEILAIDGSGYGPVTIDRSVSIIANPGAFAGIGVFSGGTGITIATAGVNVVLRGLMLNGQNGSGAYGVHMTNGTRLVIENCVFTGFSSYGVLVTGPVIVRVTDSTIRDNGNGIWLQDGPTATITRAIISGNGYGITGYGTAASTMTNINVADSTADGNSYAIIANSQNASAALKLSVRDSRMVGNTYTGVGVGSGAGAPVMLTAVNNMILNGTWGLGVSGAGAKAWASGNTVSDNTNGLYNYGAGVFESAGNNAIRNNTNNTLGTITTIPTM